MYNTVDIMNKGMQCLTEHMGVLEAEHFISIIIKEKFDYTKWQREYFDRMPQGEFYKKALEYSSENPYRGSAERVENEM